MASCRPASLADLRADWQILPVDAGPRPTQLLMYQGPARDTQPLVALSRHGVDMSVAGRFGRLASSMAMCGLLLGCGTGGVAIPASQEPTIGPVSTSTSEQTTGSEPTSTANPTRAPGPGPGRPGGSPVGVRHEIPELNDSLSNREDWNNSFRGACIEKNQPATCLKIVLKFFEEQKNGKLVAIADPGDNYQDTYDDCHISNINPPTGTGKTINSGSTVTITITCIRPPVDTSNPSSTTPTSRR